MNTLDQLQSYLRILEARLRWLALSRGLAIVAGAALGATVALVLMANVFAFSPPSVSLARLLLFISLALAVGFALMLPLLRLSRRRAARRAEQTFPQFQERLLTFVERSETRAKDPFLELLAADTAAVAQHTEPARLAPGRSIFGLAASAGAAGVVLLWMILAGPGYMGHGAALLWAGAPRTGVTNFYDVLVQPGDRVVRRKADQLITAQLVGFQAPRVRLFARYRGTSKWEEAMMLPQPKGTGYEFLFAGLPESVDYYVEAAGLRSKTHKLDVIDLPAIKHLRVTYHFPSRLGLKDAVEDPGGDLRAVEGTVAELTVQTDRPLKDGAIVLEDESQIPLKAEGSALTARVPIQKDGLYHFAAIEHNQAVRLSEDFFIEARKDGPPMVRITRPGRDAKVSPIEEVAIAVEAEDDFGLQEVSLHYSVNGGQEKAVSMLPEKNAKRAGGRIILYLEDFKMQPGDIVALYATARDARTAARTDMYFVEAEPFEKTYRQAQAAGDMGSGQQQDDEISRRQKEIIAATWNEIRAPEQDRKNKAQAAENGRFLSDVQSKLRDQAKSLADRARARGLANTNEEFQAFVRDLEAAAENMGAAAQKLKALAWQESLAPQQKALQHVLRAEATMRDIQVAFGNRGGGMAGAGRDLANLFDLELDTEKNQYETGQQQAGERRERDIDEALQRLERLAKRQQELAEQQRRQNQQSFDQRWQQEMLRREAEQLQRQMEQLTRSGSSSQQQQSSEQSGQPSSQQPSSAQGGRPQRFGSPSDRRLQQALERLSQATEDMRRAAQNNGENGGQPQAGQANANSRRAAERLQEAKDLLGSLRRQEASQQVADLAGRAERLASGQRDFVKRLQQAFGNNMRPDPRAPQGLGQNQQQAQQLASEKENMAAELERLEQDTQKAVHDLAGSQPAASSKLRHALGEAQQQELKLRMKFNATGIRQGYGGFVVPREAPVTAGLEQLRDGIRAAQEALDRAGRQEAGKESLEQTLARVEQVRGQMESLTRGRQNGQPQRGVQQGQPPGPQNGQQQSGQPQGGSSGSQQSGDRRDGSAYSFNGGLIHRGYDLPDRPPDAERTVREAARDLNDVRRALADNPDLAREVAELAREIQRLSFGAPQAQELDERLKRQVLPSIEQLELQLRRKLDEQRSGVVRTAAPDTVPPGYADAVAEYFRRLSKGK